MAGIAAAGNKPNGILIIRHVEHNHGQEIFTETDALLTL